MSSSSSRRTPPHQDGFPQFGFKLPRKSIPSWPSSDEDLDSSFSSLARQNLAARGKPTISLFSAASAVASSSRFDPKKERKPAPDIRTLTKEARDNLAERCEAMMTYAYARLDEQSDHVSQCRRDRSEQSYELKMLEIEITCLRGWTYEEELDGYFAYSDEGVASEEEQEAIRGWEERLRVKLAQLPIEKELEKDLEREAERAKALWETKKKFVELVEDGLERVLRALKNEETPWVELLVLVEDFWEGVSLYYPHLRIEPDGITDIDVSMDIFDGDLTD